MLYKTIEMNFKDTLVPYKGIIHLLLRTVIERPPLAELITSLSLVGNILVAWSKIPDEEPDTSEMANVLDLVTKTEIPESTHPSCPGWANPYHDSAGPHPSWAYMIMEGRTDIYQTLLISQLPNLQKLGIGLNAFEYSYCFAIWMQNALCFNTTGKSISGLCSLRHVEWGAHPSYRKIYNVEVAEGIHALEALYC